MICFPSNLYLHDVHHRFIVGCHSILQELLNCKGQVRKMLNDLQTLQAQIQIIDGVDDPVAAAEADRSQGMELNDALAGENLQNR
jgi:hypothetical protein